MRSIEQVKGVFEELLNLVHVIRAPPRLGEVLELAVREGLSFYDAAYLFAARRYGLRLVTMDKDLLGYPEAMIVEDLVRELKGS